MNAINPFELIHAYYSPESLSYQILIQHSILVTKKALQVALQWNANHADEQVDTDFIYEAAMLHDIGILETNTPEIGCMGTKPYIYHILAGYEILMKHHLPKHAQVALSHTGVGITPEHISAFNLPLPLEHTYVPQTREEQIISYADLFFGKSVGKLLYERSADEVRGMIAKYGDPGVYIFDEWRNLFG